VSSVHSEYSKSAPCLFNCETFRNEITIDSE
jgi:hypothetical protein